MLWHAIQRPFRLAIPSLSHFSVARQLARLSEWAIPGVPWLVVQDARARKAAVKALFASETERQRALSAQKTVPV